jgi:hypothetical protein
MIDRLEGTAMSTTIGSGKKKNTLESHHSLMTVIKGKRKAVMGESPRKACLRLVASFSYAPWTWG